jgi:hypothetical protein
MKRRFYLPPTVFAVPLELCEWCGKRAATLTSFNERLCFCDRCGTPCGDDCCGVEVYQLANTIRAIAQDADAELVADELERRGEPTTAGLLRTMRGVRGEPS